MYSWLRQTHIAHVQIVQYLLNNYHLSHIFHDFDKLLPNVLLICFFFIGCYNSIRNRSGDYLRDGDLQLHTSHMLTICILHYCYTSLFNIIKYMLSWRWLCTLCMYNAYFNNNIFVFILIAVTTLSISERANNLFKIKSEWGIVIYNLNQIHF